VALPSAPGLQCRDVICHEIQNAYPAGDVFNQILSIPWLRIEAKVSQHALYLVLQGNSKVPSSISAKYQYGHRWGLTRLSRPSAVILYDMKRLNRGCCVTAVRDLPTTIEHTSLRHCIAEPNTSIGMGCALAG
jgi:hypothetical protein